VSEVRIEGNDTVYSDMSEVQVEGNFIVSVDIFLRYRAVKILF